MLKKKLLALWMVFFNHAYLNCARFNTTRREAIRQDTNSCTKIERMVLLK